MIDSYGRSTFQKLLVDPLVKIPGIKNSSPTFITFLGLLFGVAAFFFIWANLRVLAIIFLLISGYLDALDGSLARKVGKVSIKGSALDIFFDRIVEVLVVLGLFLQAPHTRAFFTIFLLISIIVCVTSFLVVGIFEKNVGEKSFHYSPGIIERGEAFVFFILMIILPSLYSIFSILFSIGMSATGIIRIYQFYKS